MEANRERIDDVNERLAEVDRRLFRANKAAQFAKATYDVNRYAFEEARTNEPRGCRRAAEGNRGRSPAAERAQPRSAENRGRAHGAAGRAGQVHVGGRPAAEGDRSGQLRAEPPAPRSSEYRAELHQGLLPQRAAARLHGADADRASGRHAERRRRRQLRARDEDGSVHDVPSGDRSARLREIPAAVPNALEPVGVRRQRLASSAGDDRLHGVPSGSRRVDQLQRCLALSEQCEAARGVGREVPTGTSHTCGTTRCCRRT